MDFQSANWFPYQYPILIAKNESKLKKVRLYSTFAILKSSTSLDRMLLFRCCNTCHDIRVAYNAKGWAVPPLSTFKQCEGVEDNFHKSREPEEGCQIYGYLQVSRVSELVASDSWNYWASQPVVFLLVYYRFHQCASSCSLLFFLPFLLRMRVCKCRYCAIASWKCYDFRIFNINLRIHWKYCSRKW